MVSVSRDVTGTAVVPSLDVLVLVTTVTESESEVVVGLDVDDDLLEDELDELDEVVEGEVELELLVLLEDELEEVVEEESVVLLDELDVVLLDELDELELELELVSLAVVSSSSFLGRRPGDGLLLELLRI